MSACLLVLAAAVVLLLPRDGASLTVPDRGAVSAQWLDDQPVFVLRDEDGTVRVLDAVSPHSPPDFVKVLAWCDSSQLFEDLWHGSTFDRSGTYRGGPAPTGMAGYEVEGVGDGRVRVGALRSAPKRPVRSEPDESASSRGPACDERTALYGAGHPADAEVLDDLVVHDANGARPDLWIPTPDRVLGRTSTHLCMPETTDVPPHVCSETP